MAGQVTNIADSSGTRKRKFPDDDDDDDDDDDACGNNYDDDRGRAPQECTKMETQPAFHLEKGTTPDRRKTVIKNRKVAVPTWQNYLQALAFFYAWYGHFNVPSEYIDRDSGLNLGAWVKTVRNEYLAKSKNPSYRSQLLSTQRVTILEAMGFDWEHSQDEPTISWASEFLQARAGTDDKFVAWAKEQIRLMRDKGDDESRESELDFHHFQLCFRLSFLELVVDKVSAATKNED